MPGGGRHRFYFVGKEPLVLRGVGTLLFVNTFLLLTLTFGAKYFLPKASVNRLPCEALAWEGVQYLLQKLFAGTQAVQSPSSLFFWR
jgi:hypothetical protein